MSLAPLLACLCFSLSIPLGPQPTGDRWLGEDKAKHFAASFVVTAFAASGARAAGLETGPSVWVGAGVGSALGAWKEIRDARRPDAVASVRDLVWDLAGVGAASAVMAQVR